MGDDYNREAFATAQRATVAPNFHEARAILSGLTAERISDPDVAKYVEFCNDLTGYCIDHGIQRSAGLNPWSVLVTADKGKAVSTLAKRWWQWDWLGPVASLVGGWWLALRLRGWVRLQEKLVGRYGSPAEG